MPSTTHNEEATTRDAEVSRLHPGAQRQHLRATLPAKVVLRDIESHDGEGKIGLVSADYLTAVVVDGSIEFYAGTDPVRRAGSLPASRVVEITEGHELEASRPGVWPLLRLTISEGDTTLDIDLEVFRFAEGELLRETEVGPDIAWWKSALGK